MRGVPNREVCRRLTLYVPAEDVDGMLKQVRHAAIDAEMGNGEWILLAIKEKLAREKAAPTSPARTTKTAA